VKKARATLLSSTDSVGRWLSINIHFKNLYGLSHLLCFLLRWEKEIAIKTHQVGRNIEVFRLLLQKKMRVKVMLTSLMSSPAEHSAYGKGSRYCINEHMNE
jgi:hypothetical protein